MTKINLGAILFILLNAPLLIAAEVNSKPCWYNNPVSKDRIGAVGLARNLDIDTIKPIQYSRQRAIDALSNYLNIKKIPEPNEIDISIDKVYLNGLKITFDDEYEENGYLFSYAFYGEEGPSNKCDSNSCNFYECNPRWLCEPSYDGTASLLGTAYQSDNLWTQYRLAKNSALKQLESVFGIKVNSEDTFVSQATALNSVNIASSNSNIKLANFQNPVRYIVKNICWKNKQLFLRLGFPDLPKLTTISSNRWMYEPVVDGHEGAIGSVQGNVASGLLSEKISLAINRGLLELAKSVNSEVTENLLEIERNGEYYHLSVITQKTKVELKARVNGLHFSRTPSGISVFAWLVRTDV